MFVSFCFCVIMFLGLRSDITITSVDKTHIYPDVYVLDGLD